MCIREIHCIFSLLILTNLHKNMINIVYEKKKPVTYAVVVDVLCWHSWAYLCCHTFCCLTHKLDRSTDSGRNWIRIRVAQSSLKLQNKKIQHFNIGWECKPMMIKMVIKLFKFSSLELCMFVCMVMWCEHTY